MPSRDSEDDREEMTVAGATMLGDAIAGARSFASSHGLGPRDRARLCIIVEEIVANLIEHGGHDPAEPVRIRIERRGDDISLTIEDRGAPFDPRQLPGDRRIPDRGGGAGLRLVKSWSTITGYEHSAGANRLSLSLPLRGL